LQALSPHPRASGGSPRNVDLGKVPLEATRVSKTPVCRILALVHPISKSRLLGSPAPRLLRPALSLKWLYSVAR
jgi:hypothetical protein